MAREKTTVLRVRELDDQRIIFEAMVHRVGGGHATRAFSRAINHETAKAQTAVKRVIASSTGIRAGDVQKQIRRTRATVNNLSASIVARGEAFPLKYFGAKQFSFGVRAKPWGQWQRFPHAFVSASLGGHVFVREGSGRLPIRQLWGPSVPAELMRPAAIAAFDYASGEIVDRALYELRRIFERRRS
ncbi:phage tail protein [Paracoccus aminophilus]|uniref:Uncharacterized protein n=1 Tax=Paracoccus aminophilus JCM 7686 TaxID=1367847 RepID=S5YW60_PARAH|nr:phage tail protein [Paracoccus aminophilus]AGT09471.1 hypothetical protein JCM7686_2403 [Paracoccus aminophilus JCM 7686]